MSKATILQDFGIREEHTAGAALEPGDVVQTADGLAGIVAGNSNVASGAKCTVITDAIVSLPSASGTTFSAGAAVQWDNGGELVVAAGGAGDFVLGSAFEAKTSGQTIAKVRLNQAKIAMP
jgi:predicted RecA/RadA family phage recombinase